MDTEAWILTQGTTVKTIFCIEFMLLKCLVVPNIVSTCYKYMIKLPWALCSSHPSYQCRCLWRCMVNRIKEILWVRNILTSFTAWSCKLLYQHKWERQCHWEKQRNKKPTLRKISMWLKFKRLTIDLDCLKNLERYYCDTYIRHAQRVILAQPAAL